MKISLALSLVVLGSAAVAQQGFFQQAFNHQNWRDPPTNTQPYRYSVSSAAWQRAKNDQPGASPPCPAGAWVRAMHLSLIPTPPLQGRVLVFDGNETTDPDGTQFWSIMDPIKPLNDLDKFWNFELTGLKSGDPQNPPGRDSDLGCAGHCWTKDGKLIVAGGTSQVVGAVRGAWFAHEFDPRALAGNTMWRRLGDMKLERWYSSCALAWDNGQKERILAAGGRDPAVTPVDYDKYEAVGPPSNVWQKWGPVGNQSRKFRGPESTPVTPTLRYFHFYPWLRLLSNGDLFRAGFPQDGAVVHHVDGIGAADASWQARGRTSPLIHRDYGASFLFPNIDALHTDAPVVLGGQNPAGSGPVLKSFEICKGTATAAGGFQQGGYDWTPLPDMVKARIYLNAVILPDASIVVFGGRTTDYTYVAEAELYRPGSSGWQLDAAASSARDYHSTAVLLPDATVLTAGGDNRCSDYQIYVPPYLAVSNPRPVFVPSPPQLDPGYYNTSHTVQYSLPAGATIAKVVLMRPGSTTHHSDFDQRYVQLVFETLVDIEPQTGTYVDFTLPIAPPSPTNPPNSNAAPPGWYMLFLLTDIGVPSIAGWVKLKEQP